MWLTNMYKDLHGGKVLHPLPVRREFSLLDCVKNNINDAARGYPGLVTSVKVFFVRVWESLLVIFLHLLTFRLF